MVDESLALWKDQFGYFGTISKVIVPTGPKDCSVRNPRNAAKNKDISHWNESTRIIKMRKMHSVYIISGLFNNNLCRAFFLDKHSFSCSGCYSKDPLIRVFINQLLPGYQFIS